MHSFHNVQVDIQVLPALDVKHTLTLPIFTHSGYLAKGVILLDSHLISYGIYLPVAPLGYSTLTTCDYHTVNYNSTYSSLQHCYTEEEKLHSALWFYQCGRSGIEPCLIS